jgi:hypothetical protein
VSRKPEAGSRKPEAGSQEPEAGSQEPEAGSQEPVMSLEPTVRESERGAVLLHVAFAILGLMAFSTFAIDNGIFWLSRRQAQNAADAGALSGAIALSFDDPGNTTGNVTASARAVAAKNFVWGETPSVEDADVTFPACPDGTSPCIRVDVYRTSERGNPLPMLFGQIVGLTEQDVRATATAQVLVGNATDCLKPWGVIDRWAEHYPVNPAPWTPTSTFDKYDKKGNLDPKIATPDVYVAPTSTDPGTGFRPYNADGTYSDVYGLQLNLKLGDKNDFNYATGWFAALALDDSRGGNDYGNNIKSCVGVTYGIGDEIPVSTEPGEKVGPTRQAVDTDEDSLINKDPYAYWDSSLNEGHGGVAGSAFSFSPRIVAVPLVNPDLMDQVAKGGRTTVPISNIMGFFIERYDTATKSVVGRLMTMPGLKSGSSGSVTPESAFMKSISLVR